MSKRIISTFIGLVAMLLMGTMSLFAQQTPGTVSGKVLDSDGMPLAGVVVMAKGNNANAATTDLDGNFTFKVPAGTKTIVFSCLGMETQEIDLGNRTFFEVKMAVSAFGLNEAVAVGYGTMIKRELSSSVASVKSDELGERATALNIMQSLAGKVAGVRSVSFSGRPGGTSALRIRGMGSINAGSDPIYVMDGVVDVDPSLVNPADIESIDVLKDAAATSMYGAKGSNGVVLITTKSGKSGKGTVTYDAKVGVSMLTRKLDLLNAEEFMEVQKRAYDYSGATMPHLLNPMENLFYYKKDSSGNYVYDENGLLIASPKYDTDWQDVMTRNAIVNDHSLSFTAGTEKTSVYAGVAYQNVEGLLYGTDSNRMTGTINVKSQITDWLDIQAVVTGGATESNNADSENGFGQGSLRNMMEMPPIVPVKYEDGTWGRKHDYPLGEEAENPLRLMESVHKKQKNNFMVMSLTANLKLCKDLTLTVKGDYQMNNGKSISYATEKGLIQQTENNGGYATIGYSDSRRWANEDYLTYSPEFFSGKLKSNFVLGASWYYYRAESATAGAENFFDGSFDYHNLGAGSVIQNPSSGMNQNTMNSYYFRMNHNILNKYMIGFTFRADGASNFGANNKYGFFPSASAAWLISEEPFFAGAKDFMRNLKLRVSYGAVGNASIPNYRTISQYSTGTGYFNGNPATYVTLSNLGNSDLKWETSKQLNVGLDFSLFRDRLEIIADYYNKNTTDLLFQKQVPYTTGYSTSWTNLGKIRNRGFEVTLTSHNIDHPEFQWDTDFIFSTNKIVVVDINGETIDLGNNARAVEGMPWGSFFVLNRIGTWGLDEVEEASKYGKKPGDLKYEDVNKDYVIDDNDRQYMGSGTPKGEFSMVNTFNWKGFSLMVDIGAQYGAKVMNITTTMMENRQLYSNSMKSVLDAWSPEHQNTLIAAIRRPSDAYFGENEKDSRMIYSGDFIRIRNIMLSYDFKHSVLKNVKFVKGLMLGVTVENPYVFTKYPGYDPEVGAFGNVNTGSGIDFYSYPKPMTVSGNLKITF
ncbi:MAG: SusC/RagA family TonB-linked outer membrane protein [Candidatus Cryptobacteroides sp.]